MGSVVRLQAELASPTGDTVAVALSKDSPIKAYNLSVPVDHFPQ